MHPAAQVAPTPGAPTKHSTHRIYSGREARQVVLTVQHLISQATHKSRDALCVFCHTFRGREVDEKVVPQLSGAGRRMRRWMAFLPPRVVLRNVAVVNCKVCGVQPPGSQPRAGLLNSLRSQRRPTKRLVLNTRTWMEELSN